MIVKSYAFMVRSYKTDSDQAMENDLNKYSKKG
jgi:hypothetical protein